METKVHTPVHNGKLQQDQIEHAPDDSLPVGLLPPNFEPEYVAGAVKLDLPNPEKLPVGPAQLIDDDIAFQKGPAA